MRNETSLCQETSHVQPRKVSEAPGGYIGWNVSCTNSSPLSPLLESWGKRSERKTGTLQKCEEQQRSVEMKGGGSVP